MTYAEPADCLVDVERGVLRNATGRYGKLFRDLAGLYADAAAFDALSARIGGEIVYEVTEYRPNDRPGDMIFGVTRMAPGRVGAEFFLTRGHIHARPDRPEVYYGQKGEGLMLMESPDGETRIVAMGPQTICYVPPFWIHRSVNTGAGDFVTMFAYPADSGQDYAIIERSGGMRTRVVADAAGGWEAVENAGYRPRSGAEVAALAALAASAGPEGA